MLQGLLVQRSERRLAKRLWVLACCCSAVWPWLPNESQRNSAKGGRPAQHTFSCTFVVLQKVTSISCEFDIILALRVCACVSLLLGFGEFTTKYVLFVTFLSLKPCCPLPTHAPPQMTAEADA